ncbi:MAG TPA: winged helix DNA-binding domain-containing protein [Candidatus Thermoplasmatota archaeon]|nr:winged helix DNA-binding domain-containing protein [Candidatus Thermoplasmatota archaeon]
MRSIARERLVRQRLAGGKLAGPGQVVRWMGAVQAQDVPAALWAVAQRTRAPRRDAVLRALDRGDIVRTWPMRRTLHLVPAEDAAWMLARLAPRLLRGNAGRYRALGLGMRDIDRGRSVLRRALRGGGRTTRPAAYATLERRGVSPRGQRGIHILAHLAMEGTLCLGPLEGARSTFVLLEEWVPRPAPPPTDPLAELARRYLRSHAPASDRDFAWWAGVSLTDARAALARVAPPRPARPAPQGRAHLLSAFDELLVAYQDRAPSLARIPPRKVPPAAGLLSPTLALDGQVVGLWTRTLAGATVKVACKPLVPLDAAEREALARAAAGYARFLGADLDLRGV